jgi:hypothetical protein
MEAAPLHWPPASGVEEHGNDSAVREPEAYILVHTT